MHFGLLQYLGESPLSSLRAIFSPEASSFEGMLPSTVITAVAMLARRSMEDKFSLGHSAMLQNLCQKIVDQGKLILARGVHMLQEKKASVILHNKSFDIIRTVTLSKCCSSR